MALENIGILGENREAYKRSEEQARKQIQELQKDIAGLEEQRKTADPKNQDDYNIRLVDCYSMLDHYKGIERLCQSIIGSIDNSSYS